MKAFICGSRDFKDMSFFDKTLFDIFKTRGFASQIISGGAYGADTLAIKYAELWEIPCSVILPDWNRWGKYAGFKRNEEMIALSPDLVIAFWDGESKGTKNTIGLAKKAKIKTIIIYV